MSLLMQALKKAERAKQEQKESLKQLEEDNLKDASAARASATPEITTTEPPPAEESGEEAAVEISSDFPSLEMSLLEPEPPVPQQVTQESSPALDLAPPAPDEAMLDIDTAMLNSAIPDAPPAREEPRLELSFAEIAIPDNVAPQEPLPPENLLVIPDENLLAYEEPPPPESPPPVPPAAKEALPSFSLDLPSFIETAPPPPPPLVLNELPKSPAVEPEVRETVSPIVEKPAAIEEPPPAAPALAPALEEKKVVEVPPASSADTAKPAQQKIAKTIFAAKQGTGRNPRKLFYGVFAGLVLGLLSGGAYYYWQETMMTPMVIMPPPQPVETAPIPQDGAAPPQPVPPEPATEAAPLAAPAAAPTPSVSPAPAAAYPVPPAPPPKASTSTATPARTPEEESKPVASLAASPKAEPKKPEPPLQEAIPAASGIKIVRGSNAATANPLLSKAYQSFLSGDTEQAQQQYQQVLRQEPRNRDALLGMAVIAIKRQQPSAAASIYTRMLENDPNDPEAMAGLTALQGMSDPIQHESRLKNLLAKNPNAATVHFALGNLYFRQSRWAEAQSEFFRAYSGVPDNPDYAYNLAVSLDQLGQGKLALDYYQRALNLVKGNAAAFDRNATQTRIRELTPQPSEEAP